MSFGTNGSKRISKGLSSTRSKEEKKETQFMVSSHCNTPKFM